SSRPVTGKQTELSLHNLPCKMRPGLSLMHIFRAVIVVVFCGILSSTLRAQDSSLHPNWPGPGQLFVGTCYQPIERTADEIDHDIALMKKAGFNVVRVGDLS